MLEKLWKSGVTNTTFLVFLGLRGVTVGSTLMEVGKVGMTKTVKPIKK